MDSFVCEQLAHPVQKGVTLEDALLDQHAQPFADTGKPVLPGLVLELAKVEAEDDVLQLGGAIARGDQRSGDGAGRGAGEILWLVAALLEQ